MRRSVSGLLSALVAWFFVGALEHSAAAKLGAPEGAVDAAHPALCQLARSEPGPARHNPVRGGDGFSGGWWFDASVGFDPPRPSVRAVERAAARFSPHAPPCWPARSSRGPPV